MQNLESKLLSEVKAKSNPDYYNKAVAPSGDKALIQVKVCLAIVKIINDKIKNKEEQEQEKLNVLFHRFWGKFDGKNLME